MSADTPEEKGSVAEARHSPPAVPPQLPPADSAPGAPPQRLDLEKALAEVERLSLESKDHAATKSTAERQAADLTTLRKFHEKAHSEIERLKQEKAMLTSEKEYMLKQVSEAATDRRKRERAEADTERLKFEVKRVEGEKAALEKKLAEAEAVRAVQKKSLEEMDRLNRRVQELEAAAAAKDASEERSGELFPQTQTPRLAFGAALPDTQVMPPCLPETPGEAVAGAKPDTLPMPATDPLPLKAAPEAAKGEAPGRIRYNCVGCSRKLGAPPEFAGTYGTCKFCGHRMKVPLTSTR
ncbi:MAG: Response regulator receiver [Planctomycetota bacterium]|nr:MAG: Response regulator receiver [Planctomycetota bacterium]